MRSQIGSLLRKSSLGRSALEHYYESRWGPFNSSIKKECKKLRALLDTEQASIRIVYDNLTCPPAYGEFVQVVMLARYLKASGGDVKFIILDDGERRDDWCYLDLEEQESFVRDQIEIATRILSSEIEVLKGIPNSSSYVVFGANVLAGLAIYVKTPLLLNKLIETSEEPLPADFLLPISWGMELGQDLNLQGVPFVAWGIRKGVWGLDRDNTQEQVITDFRDLRKLFPGHRILLLSTPNGIEWVLSILHESGDLDSSANEAQLLFPQPTPGFINAIPWVLSADEYFQKEGGGMGIVPIFSEVPYLIVSKYQGIHYQHQFHGEKVVAWASPRQRFVHRPHDAHRVLFSDLYTQPTEVS